jgi:hypothetical protein
MTAELCGTHPDPDLWWREENLDEAWAICRRCPAFDGCERGQEIALLEGVGFLLDGFPIAQAPVVEHGNRAVYMAGCHDGTDGGACTDCRAANRSYVARWRAQKRAVTGAEALTSAQLDLWETA